MPMKTARLASALLTLMALCGTASATNFAILLGGSGDDKRSGEDQKDWIVIESVAWTAPKGGPVAAPAPAGASAANAPRDAYRPGRDTPKPVVLSVQTANLKGDRKDPFVKGHKLGSIRLRSDRNVYILHDAVVASVVKKGGIEEVTLNYTKIENADIPGRARARMAGDPDRPVVTGRSPNAPPAKEKEPKK